MSLTDFDPPLSRRHHPVVVKDRATWNLPERAKEFAKEQLFAKVMIATDLRTPTSLRTGANQARSGGGQ